MKPSLLALLAAALLSGCVYDEPQSRSHSRVHRVHTGSSDNSFHASERPSATY